ncbi:MAG: 5'-3' exonuclease [Myxococcota bacterium]
MIVHLVDGTYELFRHHFALPDHVNRDGMEVAATRGVLGSVVGLVEGGASHVGVATDHVIESFRNALYPGYKTGEGIEPELRNQFELLEDVLRAAGFAVFAMVEHEADDGLATAAATAAADPRVERVEICTPDKDLAQCVEDPRVVQVDRRKGVTYDEKGVVEKFGVPPESIADYLALVGDSADGFPGLPGWGAKSAATVLSRYGHIEAIPADPAEWDVKVRGAAKLAATLERERDQALLFRRIATVVTDVPGLGDVDDWRWSGPSDAFEELCDYLELPNLPARVGRLAKARA